MVTPEVSVEDPGNRNILISADLFEADPSSVFGLCERISVDEGIDPDFQPIPYDTKQTTNEMVRCSVCAHRARHFSGFIVRNGVGELGLVGIECGESRLFGEGGWQEMMNRTVRAQKAALYQHSWNPARAAAETASDALRRWADLARSVDEQQDEFKDSFEELASRLHTELKDGVLHIQEQVTQWRRAADGSEREVLDYVPKVALRTTAAWFFRGRTFSNRIRTTERKLNHASSQLSSDASHEDIVQIKAELKEAGEVLDQCVEMLRQLAELEKEEFWRSLSVWARSEKIPPQNLRVANGELRGSDGNWDYTFSIPDFGLPQLWSVAKKVQAAWPRI